MMPFKRSLVPFAAPVFGTRPGRELLVAVARNEETLYGHRVRALKVLGLRQTLWPWGKDREADGEAPEAETKCKPVAVTRPSELLDAVLAAGRKGLSIQRYKGLGEMNAEQLWETTLDPSNRSLLRVEVAQADVADEIFTRLMGDVVEPRREFIQDNALSVANLDV